MATRELRLLGVLILQDIADAVEEFHVALLGILLEGLDEGVRHGTCRLGGNGGVGTVIAGACQLLSAERK